ncbi:MAG: hypothetical protein FJ086_08340 [Deltaproteobacteria bacterium]|nr:hypothetical protein [Deltaproteobacteria bacterium]
MSGNPQQVDQRFVICSATYRFVSALHALPQWLDDTASSASSASPGVRRVSRNNTATRW